MNSIPKLVEARRLAQHTKKLPQFRSVRDKLTDDYVPKIYLEIAYERKDTGDIIILKDLDKTPVQRFPPSTYKKLYESVSVKVSIKM